MTPTTPDHPRSIELLEQILAKVNLIDERVEDVLDRLHEYMADLEHEQQWHDHGYDLHDHDDYLR
jgi:hypothetical protein